MANVNPIIGANAMNPAAAAPRAVEAAQQNRPARVEAERQEAQRQQTESARTEAEERELDNVIAVSKDGDTVQASDEAVRELNEEDTFGRVIGNPDNDRLRRGQTANGSESREELLELELERSAEIREAQLEAARVESEERRAEAAESRVDMERRTGTSENQSNAVLANEEATIKEEGQISSFIGYSDAELERMYLQGSISKFDYDQEMESRAEEDEARREELTDFALETADRAAQIERSERRGEAIEKAFSDDANERLDTQSRAQILQAMQRVEQAESSDPNTVAPLTNFALS